MTLDWFVVLYFFLSILWLKWKLTNKFCESQLFFEPSGNLRHYVLGVKPRFRDKATETQMTVRTKMAAQTWDSAHWPCRLAECLMNLEVVVQFSELGCSKQKFDWSWQTNLVCHSWSALQWDLSKALPTLNRLKSLSMQMDWQSLGRIPPACLDATYITASMPPCPKHWCWKWDETNKGGLPPFPCW